VAKVSLVGAKLCARCPWLSWKLFFCVEKVSQRESREKREAVLKTERVFWACILSVLSNLCNPCNLWHIYQQVLEQFVVSFLTILFHFVSCVHFLCFLLPVATSLPLYLFVYLV